MPIAVSIIDNATPWLKRLAVQLNGPGVKEVAGRAGQQTVRDHLYDLDRERHRSHVSPHFYGRAARSTHSRVTADGAEIHISHEGIAQRYFGGRIVPVNARALTIPIAEEADGKRASEFDDLFVWKDREKGTAYLARARGKGKYTEIQLLYKLLASVEQDPDHSVLPKPEDLQAAARTAVDSYITRIAQRGRS